MQITSRLMLVGVGMIVAALTAIAALAGSTTPAHSAPVVPEGFTHSRVAVAL